MIQELLGGVVEERKFSIPGVLLSHDHHLTSTFPAASSSCSSSSSLSSPSQQSNSAASSPSSVSSENLRCPRCDSSNTKFCYYNNYNLTQPRHFCKTCRRYWTKGGALRNVPIGGGCRKAKPGPPIASSAAAKSAAVGGGKAKPMAGSDAMGLRPGVEHELLPSAPILWAAAAPHSSHLLALLRASQAQNCNPNPNPNANPANILNSIRIKEDGGNPSHHVVQSLSLDPLGQLSVGPCGSLWRNEAQYQYHHQQQQQPAAPLQQHSVLGGEVSSLGIQELYQRLRSSTANYGSDHLPVVNSNVCSAPACSLSPATTAAMVSSGSIMEPAPLAGGEFGYWNPALAWNDLPTTNGAFP